MKIYTAFAPTPSRVAALVRLLAGLGGTAPRRVVARLFDPTAEEWAANAEPADVREVIQACDELDLIDIHEEPGAEVLKLSADLPTPLDDHLPVVLTARALRPRLKTGYNQFATVCAWLLAQPITGGPQGYNPIHTALQRAGLDKDIALLKDRLPMVLYWARYLGLIERLREEKSTGIVPDPTEFLRRYLDRLLPSPEAVPAAEFRRALGRLCPVLDGGEVRSRVQERMKGAGLPVRPVDQLSDALSLALRRLRAEKVLYWTYLDDADEFLNLSRDERAAFFVRGAQPTRETT